MTDENVFLAWCLLVPLSAALLLRRLLHSGTAGKGFASVLKVLVGNLLALVFFLGVICLGGEIYYRFVCDQTDSFDFTKISQRWRSRHWHENKYGQRDDTEYSAKIERPRSRLTFVGDSFTAGYGIRNVEDRFVNRLRRDHPDLEIHMLAHPGFDTADEIEAVKQRPEYELDRVVLVYCLNDISDIMPEWKKSVAGMTAKKLRQNWFVENSYALNTLYSRIVPRRDPNLRGYCDFVLKGYAGSEWEQQKIRLKDFVDLVRSRGGKPYVVTFPFLHALGPEYPFGFVHRNLDSFWRSLSVPHLDLLNVYSNLPPSRLVVNRFDAHPNEYANELAARAIDSFLMK